jgi:hypothetical protein
MSKALMHRLFGLGKMPADVRAQLPGERELYFTEGIRISIHRKGRVPGAASSGGVRMVCGSFAVTDQRVVGYRGRARLVHVPFDVTSGGPAHLTLDDTGLHVDFDLDEIHPSCRGELRIHFREELAPEVLARFPARDLRFPVDPQAVVRLWGSRMKLPDAGR